MEKPKFKPGDKVIVKPVDPIFGSKICVWDRDYMKRFVDQEVTIWSSIGKNSNGYLYTIKEDNGDYFWGEDCLVKQEETPNTIIKNVIYSCNKTIVFWMDGTKTVVSCAFGDTFDPIVGIAMATAKKFLGNNSNKYHDIMDLFLPESYKFSDTDFEE